MFMRNVTMFQFSPVIDWSQVEKLLPLSQLQPVGSLELSSRGFISPYGRESGAALSHRSGAFLWLAIGTETKIIPAASVNEMLETRLQALEAHGQRPGGRERRRMKDDLLHELLPRALVKSARVDMFVDTQRGIAFVDTSSSTAASDAVSEVRGLLGSFPASRLRAAVAPRSVMTGWVAGEQLPGGLSLGEECELRDPVEGGATIRCQHQELRCDEVEKHLEAGKQVYRLALIMEDSLSFVISDDLVIRKLKFLDGAFDSLAELAEDEQRQEMDARFALQTGQLSRLFDVLQLTFQLEEEA